MVYRCFEETILKTSANSSLCLPVFLICLQVTAPKYGIDLDETQCGRPTVNFVGLIWFILRTTYFKDLNEIYVYVLSPLTAFGVT